MRDPVFDLTQNGSPWRDDAGRNADTQDERAQQREQASREKCGLEAAAGHVL